jgi:folate-binding protein YgfZ
MTETGGPKSGHGDPALEYAAARNACAVFELPDRTQIEVTGRDRAKFLHNFCTNDIRGLAPGKGCEAFVTNVQGKVLGHIFVLAGDETLWVESAPGSAERLIAHWSRYQISEDVALADRSGERGCLHVAGPGATEVLNHLAAGAGELPPLAHHEVSLAGGTARVFRNDILRLPGFFVTAERGRIEPLANQLAWAGARRAEPRAFEALRIEAGFPQYGVDVTDANLAQEVNRTAQAISFTKGCYLGQEPIARIDALGHVNQQLRILRLDRTPLPGAGAEVFWSGDSSKVAGHVTSAVISPADERPVALAYLRRNFDSVGMKLSVRMGDDDVPAVVAWPE